ncbi:hypothetical protein [Burkholderia diffusa]|uniref:hypothetical protein n=1 Tax=Burkholderia diffusa TaxID=488732 RepID=UPI00158ECF01|nr:hypothetical protein [Burkholderia diffusa]
MTWIVNHLVWVGLLGMGLLVFLHHQLDLWRIGRRVFFWPHVGRHDEVHRDPVTGHIVNPDKAVKVTLDGETLLFESETTYALFKADIQRHSPGRQDDG